MVIGKNVGEYAIAKQDMFFGSIKAGQAYKIIQYNPHGMTRDRDLKIVDVIRVCIPGQRNGALATWPVYRFCYSKE